MNRCNKMLTSLLMINLITPMQATVDDKQVNTVQETVLTNLNSSRYNEIIAILIVAGIAGGLFWHYCYGMFAIDERLLKRGPEMIEKMGKEIAEIRSLLQGEAA